MEILFDHQAFSLHNHGGVSRYFSELINGINQTSDNDAYLPLLVSNNIHLKEKGFVTNHFFLDYDFSKKVRLIYEMNKFYMMSHLKKRQYDILHPTYFDSYFIPYLNKKPLVVTFHDMIHEKFSHQFSELNLDPGIINRKRLLAQQADRIIAVSESTKRDIVELLGIEPTKIEVIYHGSSFSDSSNQPADQPPVAPEPYLLYVGTRKVYKNFDGLLKVIHPALKKYNLKLICAGGGALTVAEKNYMQSLGITHLIEQRSANDQSLRNLYKKAVAFVFPSLYEGFGIPILEAFDCNCPCIISNSSSLPEVAGEAALYVDFNDSDSLTEAIECALHNTSVRQQLVLKGREQLAKFSWQSTVDKTLKVYESMV